MTTIQDRVSMARTGKNSQVIAKLKSGWLVIGDVQPLEGYCMLLADPVVKSLNDLGEEERQSFLGDMARVGDALLAVTGAYRINYEIWGNHDQALHAHITPRYESEPEEKRLSPAWMAYDWSKARKFDPNRDLPNILAIRSALTTLFQQGSLEELELDLDHETDPDPKAK